MKFKNALGLSLIFLFAAHFSFAQTAQFPIVKDYGGIYEIKDAIETPDPSLEYKIIVDMTTGADNPEAISRWVDNVARMMNLHGLAGVPKDRLHVKVVIHGSAIFTLLTDANYQDRNKVDNPNLKVYDALLDAGAEIFVCGQSLIARDLVTSDLWPGVKIAHSALTTVTTYVPQGYTYLKF
jgi:intracellular sulfur oxidation DsrE/DsrF family protein